jgi:2-C-methyl-D-erythritol 4-phosphate cytidylyltransferase
MGGTAAIVVAAHYGPGARSSPYWTHVAGRPLAAWSLDVFAQSSLIDEIALAMSPRHLRAASDVIAHLPHSCIHPVVVDPGTRSLAGIVRTALAAISPQRTIIVVHDAAQPLLRPTVLAESLTVVDDETAVVAGVPVTDTIKVVDAARDVQSTPDRSGIWQLLPTMICPRGPLEEGLTVAEDSGFAHIQSGGTDLEHVLLLCRVRRRHIVRAGDEDLVVRSVKDLALAAERLRGQGTRQWRQDAQR